jgi:hypothetical protein
MSASSPVDEYIGRLHAEGIIHFEYSTRPDPDHGARFYVLLYRDEKGASREARFPQSTVTERLMRIESAARVHGHRFDNSRLPQPM